MFAKVNVFEVVNVHNVGYIKVLRCEVGSEKKPAGWCVDFYNGQGKVIARSYEFEKEPECWEFVRRVVSDASRRDLLEFKYPDGKVVTA